MGLDDKFAKWHGAPREKIEWNPSINTSKCTGCGMCVVSCGRNVFDYDWCSRKAVVARPMQCLVGCSSCRSWCVFDAISFPNAERVKEFIKQNKILTNIKDELKTKCKQGDPMHKVQILGTGCPKCHKLAENVESALKQAGIAANVEKVTDINQITSFGVMMTPSLVIDGKIVASGTVPSVNDIAELLKNVGKGKCCCG